MRYTIKITADLPTVAWAAIHEITPATLRSMTDEADAGDWSIHQLRDAAGRRIGTITAEA